VLNLVLVPTEDGQVLARVLELPDCQVEAATEDQAIADLRQLINHRLAKAKLLQVEIPLPPSDHVENPWAEYAGIFEDDPDFAKIAEALRSERELEEEAG
jgi:hypothetical protein